MEVNHYSLFSPLFLGQSSSTPCLEIIGNQLISVSSNGQLVVHNNFELAVSCFKNATSFCSFLYFDLSCHTHRRTLPMCLSRFATKSRYAPFLPWQLSRRTAFCCLGGTPDKLSSWLSVIMWLSCDHNLWLGCLVLFLSLIVSSTSCFLHHTINQVILQTLSYVLNDFPVPPCSRPCADPVCTYLKKYWFQGSCIMQWCTVSERDHM